MTTAIPLVFQRARASTGPLAMVVVGLVILALLAYVALSFIGIAEPRLDGPELAPFRWGSNEWLGWRGAWCSTLTLRDLEPVPSGLPRPARLLVERRSASRRCRI